MERDPEDKVQDLALDRSAAAENILCMDRFHPCHSRRMDDDEDGGDGHGDSHNAMNRNMDLIQNFDIPFDGPPFYG